MPTPRATIATLTSGKLLFKNAVITVVGQAVPLIVAILVIPVLIRSLGNERFGFLTLAWSAVGYLAIFDLGVGRALTRMVAEKLGKNASGEIALAVYCGVIITAAIGTTIGIGVALASDFIVDYWLRANPAFAPELIYAIRILAVSIPLLIAGSSFRGVLEAHQRFDLINLIRIPVGVLNYVGPLLAALYKPDLQLVMLSVLFTRFLAFFAYAYVCTRLVPTLSFRSTLSAPIVIDLLRFGGWITLINLVNPLLVILDRFVLAAAVPLVEVAYYTVPAEIVSKLWILPSAVLMVLFPAFSTLTASHLARIQELFSSASKYLVLAVFPVCMVLVGGSREILSMWLGASFAEESARLLQIIMVGFLFNALAYVPFALLQAFGRPHILVAILLVECVVYPPILWLLGKEYGLFGIAIASAGRFVLETIAFYSAAKFQAKLSNQSTLRFALTVLVTGAMVIGVILLERQLQLLMSLTLVAIYAYLGWRHMLTADERATAKAAIARWR
jgi:O-antigen/teichoic acid export membrane protein